MLKQEGTGIIGRGEGFFGILCNGVFPGFQRDKNQRERNRERERGENKARVEEKQKRVLELFQKRFCNGSHRRGGRGGYCWERYSFHHHHHLLLLLAGKSIKSPLTFISGYN